MQYLVETLLNPAFEGKTLGVKFSRGKALLDPSTLDPRLGMNVDEVAKLMERDFGYRVTALEEPEPERRKAKA